MNCVRHTLRQAVGQCQHCGAGLCSDCYNYSGGVCYNCFSQIVEGDVRRLKKMWTGFVLWGLIFGVIIGIFIGNLTSDVDVKYGIMTGLGMGFYCFMGGAAVGIALQINREVRITFFQGIIMAIASLLLGPILFTVRLVQLLKFAKDVKDEKLALQAYPR